MTEPGAAGRGRRFYVVRGVRDNIYVNDVPRNAVTRAAKLAGLPIGLAGRTALGMGKRIGGGGGAGAAGGDVRADGPEGAGDGEADRGAARRDRGRGDPAAYGRPDLPGTGRAQGRRHEAGSGAVDLRGRAAAGD